MIYFVCTVEGCPNHLVEYRWDNQSETHAICGGCGTTLEATSD